MEYHFLTLWYFVCFYYRSFLLRECSIDSREENMREKRFEYDDVPIHCCDEAMIFVHLMIEIFVIFVWSKVVSLCSFQSDCNENHHFESQTPPLSYDILFTSFRLTLSIHNAFHLSLYPDFFLNNTFPCTQRHST